MKKRILLPILIVGSLAALVACGTNGALGTLNVIASTAGLSVKTDQRYGPDARNVLDVYRPEGSAQPNASAPMLLFIHGGSWTNGSKDDYKFVGESFARAGYVTAVMNYRLAPVNRYPAYVQDAAQALKYLRDHAAEALEFEAAG